MLRNYLKIGLRNLVKQKVYTLINVLGLSVGIASCALILLHVEDEYSYDQFHQKKNVLYKVSLERIYPNHSTYYDIIPHSFAEVMVQDFPEVINAVRIGAPLGQNNTVMVRYNKDENEQIAFEESRVLLADSNFFSTFSFKLIKGNVDEVLVGPNKMVITEDMAKKYFGDEDPIEKLLVTDFGNFTITGVCENIPENTHFEFDFVGSITSFPFFRNPNFMGFSAHTYLELRPDSDPDQMEQKFPEMVKTYAEPQIQTRLNMSYDEYIAAGNGYRYYLRPLTSIHLDPTNLEAKMKTGGNKTYVNIFIAIAIMILIIACINFMNLATARSAERAKEVGIRKTMGSYKAQLVTQFLTESVIISFSSMIISIGFMMLTLPRFNDLAGKQLSLDFSGSLILPGMALFAIVVGLLAGIYPAFIISSYRPTEVMKGKLHSSTRGSWLRNGLVIFQFWISIILIVGTIVVQNQMKFMQNKSLGFSKNNVLTIGRAFVLNNNNNQGQANTFVELLKQLPGVSQAAISNSIPGNFHFGIQFNKEGSTEPLTTKGFVMDDDFSETLGFKIIEGRDFGKDFNDSLSVMLNEKALTTMGIENPIGAKLYNTNGNPPVTREYTIVGIVQDYHFQSLRDEITPLVLMSNEGANQFAGFVSVRLEGDRLTETIPLIEEKWKELAPDEPFKYQFLDESLDAQYRAEKRAGELFAIFAGLAIIIACVGLFGLAAYTAELRTKEIGVRKVMGASISKIVLMLTTDFTKLVIIAFIFSIPVAWFAMNQWLDNFYYRIDISVTSFIIAGLTSLIIALITVSYQSIKAAIVNPVKSVRSD